MLGLEVTQLVILLQIRIDSGFVVSVSCSRCVSSHSLGHEPGAVCKGT